MEDLLGSICLGSEENVVVVFWVEVVDEGTKLETFGSVDIAKNAAMAMV